MRPTRSRIKLLYHKKLRAVERLKWELEKECRDSKEYIEIPETLVGYRVKLVPIDSLKNLDEGLCEAVEAATSWFRFSEKPFRFCNLKSYACEFRNDLHHLLDFSLEEKVSELYFRNKVYKKGQLKLLDISEERFQKLKPCAKKYFVQGFDRYDRRGNPVFIYHPDIPRTYVREYEEKLFWNRLYIPNGEAESEAKRLSNWLDYGKECELWHYEGCSTGHYWRRNETHKQARAKAKSELEKALQEYWSENEEQF